MSTLAEMLEDVETLDRAVTPLAVTGRRMLPDRVKDVLNGSWLGHPLHPMLTDIPIGAWTSGFLLDVFGGRRSRRAADGLIAVGVITAVPTAAAGLADWLDLNRRGRRVGVVHASANAIGLALYAWSMAARIRGRRGRGFGLSLLGMSALTVGGYLGGHLAFALGKTPSDEATEAPATDDQAAPDVERFEPVQ